MSEHAIFTIEALQQFIVQVLTKAGVPAADGAIIAANLLVPTESAVSPDISCAFGTVASIPVLLLQSINGCPLRLGWMATMD